MLKEISEPFLIIPSSAISGSTNITSSASSVKYKDSVGYQVNFTGAVAGTLRVNGSIDYNPGAPQSGGAFNAGNWVTITSQTVGSGSTQPYLFNLNQLAVPWTQLQFVGSSSATGSMSVYFTAKSLG